MYAHILVPISYEEGRDTAGALALAQKMLDDGGKITVLHVMEEVPAYAMSYVPEDYRAQSAEAIHKDLSERVPDQPNIKVVVTDGHAGRTIPDWAQAHGVDCIIVASHRPGFGDYFLGSTAARVVRHAQCSVHVIR